MENQFYNNGSGINVSLDGIGGLSRTQAFGTYIKYLIMMFAATLVGMFVGMLMGNSNSTLYMGASVLSFVFCLAMIFTKGTTKYIMCVIFCALMGVSVELIMSFYTLGSVFLAVLITFVDAIGCAYFALKAEANYSKLGTILFFCLIGVLVYELIGFFFALPAIHGLVVAIFTLYLVYDINKFKLTVEAYGDCVPPEMVMNAAVDVYLDIINILIRVLQLIGKRD